MVIYTNYMINVLTTLSPVLQALLAGLFTWGMTALGAAITFFIKDVNRKLLDLVLGFAAGVMISVSFWSLLAPSVLLSINGRFPVWFPAAAGFAFGGAFLQVVDRILPHLHLGLPEERSEGIKTALKRSTLLMLAMTLHNIPEGLALGVAFGAASTGLPSSTLAAAIVLTIGIGIQNIPEGMAVSVPLRCEGMSCRRSFLYGQLSAVVEPIAAIVGVAAVTVSRPTLPYALGFAAGTMIFVVIEEIIPESQRAGNKNIATAGAMFGFVIMMILDVAFA